MRSVVRTVSGFAMTMCMLLSLLWSPSLAAAKQQIPAQPTGAAEVLHEEREAAAEEEATNDEQQDGEAIVGFGSAADEVPYARIVGELAAPPLATAGGRSDEEDGSIGLANVVEIGPNPTLFDGVIGDSVYASTGDYDHYLVELSKGMALFARTDITGLEDPVDSVIRVYDPEGELVAFNDDAFGPDGPDEDAAVAYDEATDSGLVVEIEDSGVYSVAVAGCCLPQVDPKRAGSGAGPGSIGAYQLILEVGFVADEGPDRGVLTSEEDDGSIPLATPLGIGIPDVVKIESVIGDGPHAETTGDADFFALGQLEELTSIAIEYNSDLDGDAQLVVVLWDSDGRVVSGHSPGTDEPGPHSFVTDVPQSAEYYLSITVCCEIPSDPFDEESMPGPGAVGAYELTVSTAEPAAPDEAQEPDVDFYLVDLDVGDVLSVGFAGAVGVVAIYDPVGVLRMGSFDNRSFAYPATSPLRHQGTVGADHVAGRSGPHAIAVGGVPGSYRGELRVERASQEAQTIFLDFDGETLERGLFSETSGTFTVSPFESFLFRWNLGPQDRDATIGAIVAVVEENFETIGGVITDTVILNSLDDPDPGYVDGVTRIVIGGSKAESGVDTIGVAETIDPGNLDRDEVGLVLLDAISDGLPAPGRTLNEIKRAPDVTMTDVVGTGIGNIVSHEIGHLIGLWHTDLSNKTLSIMDSIRTIDQFIGVGDDGVFGTEDDIDVDFVIDEFDGAFGGFEDVVARARVGLGAFTEDEEIRSPEPQRTPPGKEDIDDELPGESTDDDGPSTTEEEPLAPRSEEEPPAEEPGADERGPTPKPFPSN